MSLTVSVILITSFYLLQVECHSLSESVLMSVSAYCRLNVAHFQCHSDDSFYLSQVECHVDGWSDVVKSSVTFVVPLCASHRVYTAKDK